jgi:hypothetical protein
MERRANYWIATVALVGRAFTQHIVLWVCVHAVHAATFPVEEFPVYKSVGARASEPRRSPSRERVCWPPKTRATARRAASACLAHSVAWLSRPFPSGRPTEWSESSAACSLRSGLPPRAGSAALLGRPERCYRTGVVTVRVEVRLVRAAPHSQAPLWLGRRSAATASKVRSSPSRVAASPVNACQRKGPRRTVLQLWRMELKELHGEL